MCIRDSVIKKIAEVNVTSTTQYIDFTNIPSVPFFIMFIKIVSGATSPAGVRLFRNGNYNNSNYYSPHIVHYEGAGSYLGHSNLNSCYIGTIDSSTAPLISVVYIYNNTSMYAMFRTTFRLATYDYNYNVIGHIREVGVVAQITSLRLYTDSSTGIDANSKVMLYACEVD